MTEIDLKKKMKKFVTPKVLKQTIIAACTFNLIISLFVIASWLFNRLEILKLISSGLTMKFNTALLFSFRRLHQKLSARCNCTQL